MIKSMTGYGEGKGVSSDLGISVELKSVNNRFLDCTVRIPRVYMAAEEPVKSAVAKHITRGKVDVFVTIDTSKAQDTAIRVNKPVADGYMKALRELSTDYKLSLDMSAYDLARFPDVLQAEKRETDTRELYADILRVTGVALDAFDEMRTREGARLYDDVTGSIAEIKRLSALVAERSPVTVTEYREKLESRMAEVLRGTNIDESRILAEAAVFADKTAINEELVRLSSHLAQLETALTSGEPVGRRLDFLVQELNREVNTIGSKGNDAELARYIVDLKAEIEKIREQAQNIE
jgi:uncharacterized protein (TIGR00255 family)